MPWRPRVTPGGLVYHVLNRAVARLALLEKDDYQAFERVMAEALQKHPTRLLGYLVMPNHWHLVIWPRKDGELTDFVRWVTHTYVMRWHAHFGTSGSGHLYQGRFKSFPIETDEHFHWVMRWSSLWRRVAGGPEARTLLHAWPLPQPSDWTRQVNRPQTEAELKAIRRSVQRGTPLGSAQWQVRTAKKLDLQGTLRPRGRPRKRQED